MACEDRRSPIVEESPQNAVLRMHEESPARPAANDRCVCSPVDSPQSVSLAVAARWLELNQID